MMSAIDHLREKTKSVTQLVRERARSAMEVFNKRTNWAARPLREGMDRVGRFVRESSMKGGVNLGGVHAIYRFEMARWFRTAGQSVVTPVLSTSLYFIVFGSAIGSRMPEIDGVPYGAFIIPGLLMLSLLTESISNASFGIYFPKFTGTIYEILSAPVSALEITMGYVGAAATKSLILGAIILVTAYFFVPYKILHPLAMATFLTLTCLAFCLFGFIIGIWADGFEKLQIIPMLVVMPLTFLGGAFYSIDMLPEPWRTVSLFNPVVYLVSGLRWSFFESSDVSVAASLGMTAVFIAICLCAIWWIFRTGYRLKA
jgi:ABC-2 type transport system permease protein